MKRILIARSAGFCFGVKRAIGIANETADSRNGGGAGAGPPIFSLGPIIHNPQAVAELATRGVRVVASADDVPCGKVIVRSHGITWGDREALERKDGVEVIDATCPFVNKAQEHARSLSRDGYAVIVVGDANHPEVKSIVSYIEPGVPVLTSLEEIRRATGIRKAGIVAQTTQSFENLMEFVHAALRRFPEVRVHNTICHATVDRQRESMAVAGKTDAMIVLGGYNSANTRRLAEICREINPRTHHIETADELEPAMLEGVERLGVTAGASTPQWIIDGLVEKVLVAWGGGKGAVDYYQ